MEYTIKKIENGFIVTLNGDDPLDGYVHKEYVFLKHHQVVKFIRDNLAKGEENS